MLKRLLFKDPSRTIGTIGFIISALATLGILSNQMGDGLEKILQGLLVILVPGSAEAIRTKAFAPATVVERVTEGAVLAAEGAVREVGSTAAGAVGNLTEVGTVVAHAAAEGAVKTVTGVAGTVVGVVGGVLG